MRRQNYLYVNFELRNLRRPGFQIFIFQKGALYSQIRTKMHFPPLRVNGFPPLPKMDEQLSVRVKWRLTIIRQCVSVFQEYRYFMMLKPLAHITSISFSEVTPPSPQENVTTVYETEISREKMRIQDAQCITGSLNCLLKVLVYEQERNKRYFLLLQIVFRCLFKNNL